MLTLKRLKITQGEFTLSADLSVPTGTKTAILGPSGAGKSTLLNAIAGFVTPHAGDILWHNTSLSALPPGQRPLSILFQDNNLFPHLTVAQNIGLGLRPDLRLTRDQSNQVSIALKRVGLADMGPRKPAALSGGQQSRVALARMLLRHRPLLLLDEPFAALGPALKAEMLDLVDDLLAETQATLLMVSHDPTDAKRIADQVIVVAEGQASAPVNTKALFQNPPQALAQYLGQSS